MIIGFDPIDKQDAYIEIVKKIFTELDCELVDFNAEIFSAHPQMDVAYLNWFENMPHKKWNQNFMSFLKRLAILTWLKYKHIPFIYVAHNLSLHDACGAQFADIIMKLCLKNASIIGETVSSTPKLFREIRHFEIPSQSKSLLLSIPNYEFGDIDYHNQDIWKPGHRLKILNFGMVRPYKNVESIILLAQQYPQIDFRIVGSAKPDYMQQLLNMAANVENISFRFQYLSDDELNNEILDSDIVLLPYHKETMLNSGALRHASVLGRSAICPVIGNSYELNHADYYFYDYESNEEHFKQLSLCIQRVLNDYISDRETIVKMGEGARSQHLELYNYEKIKGNYRAALQILCHENGPCQSVVNKK